VGVALGVVVVSGVEVVGGGVVANCAPPQEAINGIAINNATISNSGNSLTIFMLQYYSEVVLHLVT
jgi:hypothetical protein